MRAWLGCIIALALIVPAAQAKPETFPVEFRVVNHGSVDLGGDLEFTVRLGAIVHRPEAGAGFASLDVKDARVVVVRQPEALAWARPNLQPITVTHANYKSEDFTYNGTVDVQMHEWPSVAVLPAKEGDWFSLTAPTSSLRLEDRVRAPSYQFRAGFDGRGYTPAYDSSAAVGLPQDHAFTVSACLVAYETTLVLGDGRRIETGLVALAGNSPDDPQGVAIDEEVFAVVCAQDARVRLVGGAAWQMQLKEVTARLDGLASFTQAEAFNGTPDWEPGEASLLQVEGALELRGSYAEGGQAWDVKGTGTYLGVDGAAVQGEKGLRLSAFAAVTGSLGILALLLWFLRHLLFDGLAWLIGYSRAEPLGNPTRVRMLALIEKEPGITSAALVEALGVKRATVMFHGRVLADHGYVAMDLVDRQWHFARTPPNGADLSRSREGRARLACLRNPVRRAIHECVVEAGRPVTAGEIRERAAVDGRRLTFAFLGYHLPVLERHGLLHCELVGAVRLYRTPAATRTVASQGVASHHAAGQATS